MPTAKLCQRRLWNTTAPQWQLPNTIVNSEGWEIRKLTTGQGEDYTAGCLLDYGYIKNRYRLIAVDLSRQKE